VEGCGSKGSCACVSAFMTLRYQASVHAVSTFPRRARRSAPDRRLDGARRGLTKKQSVGKIIAKLKGDRTTGHYSFGRLHFLFRMNSPVILPLSPTQGKVREFEPRLPLVDLSYGTPKRSPRDQLWIPVDFREGSGLRVQRKTVTLRR
jgi:hypothetical protein